ncbi:MAG: CDP-alcohol phosphatidyltransferase family protein [Candidatus Gracilibacteria bacterium]|nr:CDP-alcohol phosphatidyltransferase family protein [Candidatus Gracilibacteria bacterium]
MFDNYAIELLLLKNSFAENQLLQMEFLSSLIVVIVVLWIVYRGLRYRKIRECFAIHKYEKEPENAIERFKLYVDAPLLSGNGICMWRVYLSVPLSILTILFYKEEVISSILLQFYVFLFVTDALDGAVARSLNNVTNLGKVLDPFADKFLDLIILAIVCLFSNNSFFVLSAVFICMVDIAGQSVRAKTSNPAANWVGKTKTVVKVITIYVVSLNRFDMYLDYIGGTLLIISAIFTFASFYLKVKDRLHLRFGRKRKTPRMRGVFDYINQYLFI